MTSSDEDFDLLDAWRAGDRSAGEQLFRRHFRRLYAFFSNKVTTDVGDLIQDTLRACVEGRDRIRRQTTFRGYLLGVARYQLFAHFRRQRPDEPLDPSKVSSAGLSGSPSLKLARRREQRWLLCALRQLPLDLQIVLELHYWEDLSTAELAHALEVPQGTIKSRLRRARTMLAEQIEEIAGHDSQPSTIRSELDRWARSIRSELAARVGGQGGES